MRVADRIGRARSAAELAAVAGLFRAYAATLPFDLGFQDFETELATLPGKYAAPRGALLYARDGDGPAGCVAMRPLGGGICEMKRLYVTGAARGTGLGRALVAAVLDAAERAGHREMRLDTLPSMPGALALYRAAGFEVIPPYYETPVAGTIFLSRPLA
ncbi:GNAT family N-acetyltransferase [Amaricoccus sp.]|uniref:GNAT family N-acetyltransferase n=1 Tax=Amaricoccus sp. TaxID=1872485 RepID=UPI002631C2A8|nr:GNAT family N-acetyltransferase [uncultured Amaricoccus sp.]